MDAGARRRLSSRQPMTFTKCGATIRRRFILVQPHQKPSRSADTSHSFSSLPLLGTMTHCIALLPLLLVVQTVFALVASSPLAGGWSSGRWGSVPKGGCFTTTAFSSSSSKKSATSPSSTRRRRLQRRSDRCSALRVTASDNDDKLGDESPALDDSLIMDGVSKKQLIEVTSQVELPFSAEIAYDAYSNLPRQPSWSSWLDSVVFLNDDARKDGRLASKWTMKFLGIRYSWEAVALKNERPRVMQWQSTTGLRNFGTVEFHPQTTNYDDEDKTLMTLKMTFVAPRAVSAVFRKSGRIASYVERNLISKSLLDFRDVVLKTDLLQDQDCQQASPKGTPAK